MINKMNQCKKGGTASIPGDAELFRGVDRD